MKNLENYGVKALNAKEMQETKGGFGLFLVGFLIGSTLGYFLMDWIFGD